MANSNFCGTCVWFNFVIQVRVPMKSDLINKLQQYNKFNRKQFSFIAVTEMVCAIVTGVFIALLFIDYSNERLGFALMFFAVFLYLFLQRHRKEELFAVTALNELNSSIELDAKKHELDRKAVLDKHVSDAIKTLNAQATQLYNKDAVTLNDALISDALKAVYEPLFLDPQNILNTRNARFTAGAYLKELKQLPTNNAAVEPELFFNIYVPRDDLNLTQYFTRVILTDPDLKETYFIIQTQFLDTIKHSRFRASLLTYNSNEYTFITAPIPASSGERSTGIFFIVTEKLVSLPADLESLLTVFSGLFANWLLQYNAAVTRLSVERQQHNMKADEMPLNAVNHLPLEESKIEVSNTETEAIQQTTEATETQEDAASTPQDEPTLEEAIRLHNEKNIQTSLFGFVDEEEA